MAGPGPIAGAIIKGREALAAAKSKVNKAIVQHFALGSTAISDVWYNPVTRVMWLKFRKVREYPKYRFEGVPGDLVAGLVNAQSAGNYYHTRVKGNFYTAEINGPEEGDAEVREYMFNLLRDR